MTSLWRWVKRLVFALGIVLIGLVAPPIYIEVACRGEPSGTVYQPLIVDPNWQRAESRTLLTYPEWHIVHAYDEYARVITTGAPHEFGYLRAISGFWGTLCPLTEAAASMGGVTGDTKATIYTIGVSFTAELLAKAAYEETIGRVTVWLRGAERAPLDDLSADQAAAYGAFLQQMPWYKWDFATNAKALADLSGDSMRDRERRFALGAEYGAKAAYAGVIEAAVAGVGADELRLRSVVSGVANEILSDIAGITIIGPLGDGIEIETDRYRAFTVILERLSAAGADIREIAGNDQVLLTALSDLQKIDGALYSVRRQGYGDYRHLIVVPVRDLADRLRALNGLRLEHVHDY